MATRTVTGGGGLQLAVHEYGRSDGKPIVFIHGFGACHLAWRRQYESLLAEEFRLVCLDSRGHGMSEKPTNPEQYRDDALWAEDIHAVISSLELREPILVGWSYGGYIINDYLARYGQSAVSGINYVAAAVIMGIRKAASTVGSSLAKNISGLCSDDLEENIRSLIPFLRSVFETPPSQEEFETMLAFNMVVPPAVRRALMSRTIDRDHVMKGLSLPVMVTEGAKDRVVLAFQTRHLLSHIAHAKHSRYEGVGHAPQMEDAERFNRELAAFARQCREQS